MRERLDLKYWAFRALAALTPATPLWLAQRIAVAAGALAWLGAPSLRPRAARNLGISRRWPLIRRGCDARRAESSPRLR